VALRKNDPLGTPGARTSALCQGAFILATLLATIAAYGWYTPIGRGDRFMLSLYAPLVFSLIWAC